jgi:AcrR family transcriptional regulator/DNA-binding MarR family transcriptional regulator
VEAGLRKLTEVRAVPARESSRHVSRTGAQARQWRPGVSHRARRRVAPLAAFQRARILRAAVEIAAARGYRRATVTELVAHAGISRHTFYGIYESRDDCMLAALEDAYERIAAVVTPAYAAQDGWAKRLRAALIALLAFLEREPESGALALSYLVGDGPRSPELRMAVLARLRGVVWDGRWQHKAGRELSPLTEEVVVAGVLAIIHARLRTSPESLGALVNQLMWTIVLPYLGPAAAARELTHAVPSPAVTSLALPRAPLPIPAMRLTYRTARTIEAIAQAPGASSAEIAAMAELADRGQMKKMLARLVRLGLVESNAAARAGGRRTWRLTPSGHELETAIRRAPEAVGR